MQHGAGHSLAEYEQESVLQKSFLQRYGAEER